MSSALEQAIKSNRLQTVRKILSHNPDAILEVNENGQSVFAQAASFGYLSLLKNLIQYYLHSDSTQIKSAALLFSYAVPCYMIQFNHDELMASSQNPIDFYLTYGLEVLKA